MTFKRGDVRVSWLMCLHVNHFILSELNQNEVYVVLCEQYMFVCFVLDGSVSIVCFLKRSEYTKFKSIIFSHVNFYSSPVLLIYVTSDLF